MLTYVHLKPECFKPEEIKYIETTAMFISTVTSNARFTPFFDASINVQPRDYLSLCDYKVEVFYFIYLANPFRAF